MPSDSAIALAAATTGSYLEAPAGFGKTETIADAVALSENKQLILTHTHAGIDSLRKRLRAKNVPSIRFRLETISAWCLRFVSAYPVASGYQLTSEPDWKLVYAAMKRLVKINGIRQIISASAGGVIVDEYQDCTQAQHEIILELGSLLPLRLVGDPLQGIFGFGGEHLVDWKASIYPSFIELPGLSRARRWEGQNEKLGEWLIKTRALLLTDQQPSYTDSVSYENNADDETTRKAINSVKPQSGETVAMLVKFPQQAHALAQKFPGFSSMEEIEGKDLLKACKELENKTGLALVLGLIEFVKKCSTNPDQTLDRVIAKVQKAEFTGLGKLVPKELTELIEAAGSEACLEHAESICTALVNLKGRRLYRRELYYSMIKTIRLCLRKPELSLWESARQVREVVSHSGRKSSQRIVSRVLLVKGLEYDHVIVLNPSTLTKFELYVALTRGRKSLTVIESSNLKAKKLPEVVLPNDSGQASLFSLLEEDVPPNEESAKNI